MIPAYVEGSIVVHPVHAIVVITVSVVVLVVLVVVVTPPTTETVVVLAGFPALTIALVEALWEAERRGRPERRR
jgi:hypothetical protein